MRKLLLELNLKIQAIFVLISNHNKTFLRCPSMCVRERSKCLKGERLKVKG